VGPLWLLGFFGVFLEDVRGYKIWGEGDPGWAEGERSRWEGNFLWGMFQEGIRRREESSFYPRYLVFSSGFPPPSTGVGLCLLSKVSLTSGVYKDSGCPCSGVHLSKISSQGCCQGLFSIYKLKESFGVFSRRGDSWVGRVWSPVPHFREVFFGGWVEKVECLLGGNLRASVFLLYSLRFPLSKIGGLIPSNSYSPLNHD